ncbi:MAG: AAA family ATPase [Acidobacteria bacterium]|nr:AAA family ATPase [Acidobacteriota bacterium]
MELQECPQCDGTGWVTTQGGGEVERCDCFRNARSGRRLERAGIPRRYQHCSLDNFETEFLNADPSLGGAVMKCQRFVEGFADLDEGLLFVGPVGVGKTHLAVGVLRALMDTHKVNGLFVDYRDLLRDIQDSYNKVSETSELQVVRPLLNADVLLLDELGARRPSAWVFDTVSHVVNDRYNNRRPTLITTNYPDAPEAPEGPLDSAKGGVGASLQDRIGGRLRSRLFEMCIPVQLQGSDFRRVMKRAGYR